MELHLTNSDIVAGQLLNIVIEDSRVFYFYDLLTFGPMDKYIGKGSTKKRSDFFRKNYHDSLFDKVKFDESYDTLFESKRFIAESETIYIWVGNKLADQLFLLWAVKYISLLNTKHFNVKLIQEDTYLANYTKLKSWQDLTSSTFESTIRQIQYISDEELEYIYNSWDAITDNNPLALLSHVKDVCTGLPSLSVSLNYLLKKYPYSTTGLNYYDDFVLRKIREVGSNAIDIVVEIVDCSMNMQEYYGENILKYIFSKYSSTELIQPLLRIHNSDGPLKDMRIDITDVGNDVLDYRANYVYMNGINDWVCGVHLCSSSEKCWFYNNTTDELIQR